MMKMWLTHKRNCNMITLLLVLARKTIQQQILSVKKFIVQHYTNSFAVFIIIT